LNAVENAYQEVLGAPFKKIN